MNIHYPVTLPVSQQVEKIKKTIANNQVTILCGETGSGKTTQLPKSAFQWAEARTNLLATHSQEGLQQGQ